MKLSFLIIWTLLYVNISSKSSYEIEKYNSNASMADNKIKIRVNSKAFMATLVDNNSTKAFKELLPLTMKMTELNDNEKYVDLPKSLPSNSYNPQTIKNGDLMLYGSKTFVLYTTKIWYLNIFNF
jgi:hypothetical protein